MMCLGLGRREPASEVDCYVIELGNASGELQHCVMERLHASDYQRQIQQ